MFALLLAMFLAATQPGKEIDLNHIFAQAVAAQQQGRYAEAVQGYQRLLQVSPDAREVRLNLGAALVKLNRYDEAIAQYQSVLAKQPNDDPVRLNLALAFYKKQDYGAAAPQFDHLHRRAPEDSRVAILLADCRLHSGKAADAVSLLEPLESQGEPNADLTYILGSAFIEMGRRVEGLSRIQKLADTGNNADADLLAGSTLLQMEKFDQARHYLDHALQLRPSLPDIYRLAGVAHEKDGDAAGAKPLLRQALAANPDDFTANLYLGAVLFKERQLPEAETCLRHALELDPGSSMARYEVALLETANGDFSSALNNLEQVAKRDPNWLEPHVQLAALYYRLRRPEEGARERSTVDRLSADQQRKGPQ